MNLKKIKDDLIPEDYDGPNAQEVLDDCTEVNIYQCLKSLGFKADVDVDTDVEEPDWTWYRAEQIICKDEDVCYDILGAFESMGWQPQRSGQTIIKIDCKQYEHDGL